MNKLLPVVAKNEFNGSRISLWLFILFTGLMTIRSIVHFLFPEYAFHEVANFSVISGQPDPMVLFYRLFSLWGLAQLIFCLVCWLVICRYKALIPLMYLLWLVEWAVRAVFHTISVIHNVPSAVYTNELAPGVSFAPLVVGLLVILFFHSLISGAGDRL